MTDMPEPTADDRSMRAPEGAAARPPRRRAAPADDRRARRRDRPRAAGRPTPRRSGRWFAESADSGSLERYLETFDHTVGGDADRAGAHRVARECVEDLAADGVVYAEVRYAPEQHLAGGLTLEEVVEAVQEGFDEGVEAAAAAGSSYASC